jgi:acetyl-CoA carboxylase biotin carboxyl carrier protein
MDLELIERLLEIVAQSGMAEVEVEQDDFKMVVRAHPTTAPIAAPAIAAIAHPVAAAAVVEATAPAMAAPEAVGGDGVASDAGGTVIQAPIVGTFYAAPGPDADPYVKVGDRVEVGTVLCIIEAMKLMNEIQSEHAGVVKQILAENAQPVEYDQPLFIIEEA